VSKEKGRRHYSHSKQPTGTCFLHADKKRRPDGIEMPRDVSAAKCKNINTCIAKWKKQLAGSFSGVCTI